MENRFPKNVRQIGNVSDTPKIYVEDYVDTYLTQVLISLDDEPEVIFLIGHIVRQEEQECIYISGALRMKRYGESGFAINRSVWESVQNEKNEFFPDGEIIGWCLIQKESESKCHIDYRRQHEQYFPDYGTVFVLKNPEEEQYFAYKYQELMPMNGHYIYYEKNAPMQNYMIFERKKLGMTPSEDVEDKAAKEFRNIVKERIVIQEEKKSSRMMKVVSMVLVIAVLGMGVTTINNYGKMQALQGTIEYLEDSVEVHAPAEEEEVISEQIQTEIEVLTEESISSTMQEMSEEIYIVEKGDTLVKISRKMYGDSSYVDEICQMNGLEDGNLIFIGQKLLLP